MVSLEFIMHGEIMVNLLWCRAYCGAEVDVNLRRCAYCGAETVVTLVVSFL